MAIITIMSAVILIIICIVVINEALDTKYHEMDNRLTTQLAQKANKVNPRFHSENSESPALGSELIDEASILLSDGWTGDVPEGFTHTAGVSPLTFEFPELVNGGVYYVNVDISKANMADTDGQSDYFLSLGGSTHFETYRGSVTSQTWAIKSGGENNRLIVTPFENFVGTLKFSIRQSTSGIQPHTTFYDSDGTLVSTFRFSKKSANSIYLGHNSGLYASPEATENTALGSEALRDTTTGFWNTAVGRRALAQNTVGSRNVAIGRIALHENISGDRNIAIGPFALTRNISGRSNVAIGADSLWYNRTGDHNIAVGLTAMGNNVDGMFNIAFGDHVMANSRGGEHNFAVGQNALNLNQGINNIAVGKESLRRNILGINNVGLGYQALYDMNNGNGNFGLGYRALYGSPNASGSFNSVIGHLGMYSLSTGEHNTGIGYNVMRNIKDGNNNISFGNRAMYHLKDGENNISTGQESLHYNESGDGNIASGFRSLYSWLGDQAVAIGQRSGEHLETGSDVVLIGQSAGVYDVNGLSVKTGSNIIMIGADARASSPNPINELNIGGVIKGNMSPTSGRIEMKRLMLTNLPTSPTVQGEIWNDNGTLKIL